MENIFESLKSIAGKTRETIVNYFKNTTKPDVKISDVAELVMKHPEVNKETKELLGLSFHFYHLNIDNLSYTLETKGKDFEKILEFKIDNLESRLVDYKSYRDDSLLDEKLDEDSECFFKLLEA